MQLFDNPCNFALAIDVGMFVNMLNFLILVFWIFCLIHPKNMSKGQIVKEGAKHHMDCKNIQTVITT